MGVKDKLEEGIARFLVMIPLITSFKSRKARLNIACYPNGTRFSNQRLQVFKSHKGRLIVARQFSGGKRYSTHNMRPVGTLESVSRQRLIQPSLQDGWGGNTSPTATELAGYFQPSLTGLNQTTPVFMKTKELPVC